MSLNEDLKAYIDGELSPERMEEIRKAIEVDETLRQECSELKTLGESIRTYANQFQPHGLESTLAALNRVERRKRFFDYRWPLVGLVTACVAFCFFLPNLFPRASQSDSGVSSVAMAPVNDAARAAKGIAQTKAKPKPTILPESQPIYPEVPTPSRRMDLRTSAKKQKSQDNTTPLAKSKAKLPWAEGFPKHPTAIEETVAARKLSLTSAPSERVTVNYETIHINSDSASKGVDAVLELAGKFEASKVEKGQISADGQVTVSIEIPENRVNEFKEKLNALQAETFGGKPLNSAAPSMAMAMVSRPARLKTKSPGVPSVEAPKSEGQKQMELRSSRASKSAPQLKVNQPKDSRVDPTVRPTKVDSDHIVKEHITGGYSSSDLIPPKRPKLSDRRLIIVISEKKPLHPVP